MGSCRGNGGDAVPRRDRRPPAGKSLRILHAIHDYLPRHRAGSELYAHALVRAQQRRHEVRVLAAEYDPGRTHGAVDERSFEGVPIIEVVNNWAFATFEESWRPRRLSSVFAEVLDSFHPEVVHVHNLLNLSFDLPRLARQRGAAVVGTLHDYTLVCPSGGQRVHVAEEHVCRQIEPARCARCFAGSPWSARMAAAPGPGHRLKHLLQRLVGRGRSAALPAAGDIAARLAAAVGVLEAFDLLVAPSPALAEEYRWLGAPASRLRVSDYGFPALAPHPRSPRGPRLRIGFAGTPIWHKGVHVLLQAVRHLPAERWELDVWGDLTVAPDYARRLREGATGLPVRFRGGFDRDETAGVYAGMDVLVVPSLWLENSPLVVHEAFLAGVPVVAARMGGLVDLVEEGRSGLLYEATDARALGRALERLLDEPGLLERLAAGRPAVKALDEDVAEWEAVYTEALARRRPEDPR